MTIDVGTFYELCIYLLTSLNHYLSHWYFHCLLFERTRTLLSNTFQHHQHSCLLLFLLLSQKPLWICFFLKNLNYLHLMASYSLGKFCEGKRFFRECFKTKRVRENEKQCKGCSICHHLEKAQEFFSIFEFNLSYCFFGHTLKI